MTTCISPPTSESLSLNRWADLILPQLTVKDVLACSATCREWQQITAPGDLSQKLWTTLCHRDFPNGYLQPLLCRAYVYYAAHCNGYTFKFHQPKIDEIYGDAERITAIFSAHEKLVVGKKNGAINIWDLKTKECESTFMQRGEIRACFCNQDCLVMGLSSGDVVGWRIEAKESIDFDHRHKGAVVGFGESEKYFLSMSCKGEVILWDKNRFVYMDKTQEWAHLSLFKPPFSSIKTSLICCKTLMAFSHTGKAYALTGFDQKKLDLHVEEDVEAPSTYSIDGQIISYFKDGTLRFFDPNSKSFAMTTQEENCSISSFASADTRFVLNSIGGGKVMILDFRERLLEIARDHLERLIR